MAVDRRHTAKKKNGKGKKSSFKAKFGTFLKKIGVTNPLLQVAVPFALAMVVVTIGSCAYYNGRKATYDIRPEVNVTYDTPLTVDLFVEEGADASDCEFVSDVSVIDMSQLASYKLVVANKGHKVTTILNVVDDVPPVADPVPQQLFSLELPDPNECVENLYDKSPVTVNYAAGTDISMGGSIIVSVVLTDAYNNQAVVEVPFEVSQDLVAPLILGAHDIEFKAGNPPDFMEGITVTDDVDPDPQLIINDVEVDTNTPGLYELYYIASDAAGNETMVTVNVTVLQGDGGATTASNGIPNGPSGNQSGSNKYSSKTNADAYAAAQKVYNKICNASMNDVTKGMKIFYWVNHNISFTQYGIDYTSFASLACQAFATRRSSCYGHWACCKSMCDIAGIANRTVYRSGSNKYHVWLLCYLNGGWYHCDATPWPGYGHYFIYMMTDAELAGAPGNHRFLSSGLPARSTQSMQQYININSGTVSSSMPVIATPTPEPTESSSDSSGSSSDSSQQSSSDSSQNSEQSQQSSSTPTPTPVPDTPTPTPEDTATPTPVPAEDSPTPVPEEGAE